MEEKKKQILLDAKDEKENFDLEIHICSRESSSCVVKHTYRSLLMMGSSVFKQLFSLSETEKSISGLNYEYKCPVCPSTLDSKEDKLVLFTSSSQHKEVLIQLFNSFIPYSVPEKHFTVENIADWLELSQQYNIVQLQARIHDFIIKAADRLVNEGDSSILFETKNLSVIPRLLHLLRTFHLEKAFTKWMYVLCEKRLWRRLFQTPQAQEYLGSKTGIFSGFIHFLEKSYDLSDVSPDLCSDDEMDSDGGNPPVCLGGIYESLDFQNSLFLVQVLNVSRELKVNSITRVVFRTPDCPHFYPYIPTDPPSPPTFYIGDRSVTAEEFNRIVEPYLTLAPNVYWCLVHYCKWAKRWDVWKKSSELRIPHVDKCALLENESEYRYWKDRNFLPCRKDIRHPHISLPTS
jgi:hypothetical protein